MVPPEFRSFDRSSSAVHLCDSDDLVLYLTCRCCGVPVVSGPPPVYSYAFDLRWFVLFSWHAAWLHVFAREGAVFIGVTISFAKAFPMDGTSESLRGFSGNARVFSWVVIFTRSAAVPAVVLKFALIAKRGLFAFEAMAFSWAMCAVQFARRASGGSIKPNEAVGRIDHSVSTLG